MTESPKVRGEHYAKTDKDIGKFLNEHIYPVLEKKLDRAFPEFRFKKGPSGHWVAHDAPVSFTGYGHRQQKLIANGWGFRSLTTGAPAILWLSYLNRQSFPSEDQFLQVVARLAARVKITFKLEPSPLEIRQTIEHERRNHFLESFLALSQGYLNSEHCRHEREYLSRKVGLPPNLLGDLDLGFYTSPEEVRDDLREAGYDSDEDDNFAENLGLYHPKWTGRIVGPWWDLQGRRVINLWGRHPGEAIAGQDTYVNLNRPLSSKEIWGMNSIPLLLYKANRIGKKNLVLIEDPLKTLLVHSLGVKDPFPVSSCGPLRANQVEVLSKYLGRSDTLILNMDYDPNAREKHLSTTLALQAIGKVRFKLHIVDPSEMAGADNHPWPVDAASFVKQKGVQAYRALLSRAPNAAQYHSQKGTEAGGGSDNIDLDPRREIEDAIHEVTRQSSSSGRDPFFVEDVMDKTPDPPDPLEEVSYDSMAGLQSESAAPVPLAAPASGGPVGGVREHLQTLAIKVLNDEVSPAEAIAVLQDCQEGIKTLLSSLRGKVK